MFLVGFLKLMHTFSVKSNKNYGAVKPYCSIYRISVQQEFVRLILLNKKKWLNN